MTENEQIFWNRVLELAQSQLKQATYEFFVHDARLIKVDNHVATIFLDQMKELFWEKNLKDVILTAGFEVYNAQIAVNYVYEEDLIIEQQHQGQQGYTEQAFQQLPAVQSDLNPKYSFDNFIQGDENRWAVAASIAVANTPGTTYNPLFIWGGPGLGKTHLLNAIGNSVLLENPNARIKYITAENFINEFVVHIRLDTMDELKEKFRNLDLLLIDDIQSLAKKTLSGTQEEFFNTFNALHNNNKQIVLTSDRTPDHLNDLEDRLVTRFKWGLTVNITPPDFETRVAILTNKIQEYNFVFPQDTIEYLAGQFDSNVRDLEGALKDISLVANFKQIDTITVDIAAEAIRARKQDGPKMTVIPIEEIQAQVGKFYGVTVKEIKATKRTQDIVLARQVAMFLAREMTDNSLPKIGKEFGGRDHSTVLHAYNKIKNMIGQDESLRIEIETIKNKIK
ncbi:TPA: chromosomal replication initiator protein DnaA [Streptococcus equi subsp. zooepidemicus]|uniref:Chromosomal replication initiator protein DnaA n=1 Tax=Streptococcus equi subsp. zooepidemicus TaxID=40041 RepID=A0AAX2LFF9_STRSZ|nr:chromosomal replication initiator protein DnaA [Streptococcus equi]MCD3405899.1 chromosomal replication initiator protein DnaA [Streptococcus equi subsp. zooepidemicus]SQE94939.1 chromosomal replication initiation protein [Streptococcus equi subsp. zooepidemicus]SUO80880.1 chromosomal replication initiation protein [Streptococcus equi subsp. zooepidemicus]HEL0714029.1 chromosomal replication initiator protein DnaA [Streptococcus equi subsp. zooepidemicus]HEL0756672.1 chromosomal replication